MLRERHTRLLCQHEEASLRSVVPFPHGVVSDLGRGLAPYRDFFLRHAFGYVGVDWAASRHDPHADVIAGLDGPCPSATGRPVPPSFSPCSSARRGPGVALAEAYRILESGGALVLDVPFQSWLYEALADYYRYTPFGLRHLLEQAGFEVLGIEPSSGYFTAVAVKSNCFARRFLDGRPRTRWLRGAVLLQLWAGGRYLAPLLHERLDRAPAREAHSFMAIARKGTPARSSGDETAEGVTTPPTASP